MSRQSPRIWLMKSEPQVFSFADLCRKGSSLWDGVRNYQARNFMMKDMAIGDLVLFYHSSCEEPGVVGLAKVSGPAVPDPTQFDPNSDYFEPRAQTEKPVWYCIEVAPFQELKKPISLKQIRAEPRLKDLPLLQRGQRLSIQPVAEQQYRVLLELMEK